MLKLDLRKLRREGRVEVRERIPADHPLWEDADLKLDEPLRVDLVVKPAGSGEVVARGRMEATLAYGCRRCLDAVKVPLDEELTLVYAPVDELGDEETGEVRNLSLGAVELDLAEAIREELILTAPTYVLCDPDCEGLCPQCGTNLNEEACECTLDEPDPRWDALRALEDE